MARADCGSQRHSCKTIVHSDPHMTENKSRGEGVLKTITTRDHRGARTLSELWRIKGWHLNRSMNTPQPEQIVCVGRCNRMFLESWVRVLHWGREIPAPPNSALVYVCLSWCSADREISVSLENMRIRHQAKNSGNRSLISYHRNEIWTMPLLLGGDTKILNIPEGHL